MAKTVLIDELHLAIRVPAELPAREAGAVRRTLLGAAFLRRLQRAVRGAARGFPELATCRLSLSR